MTPEKMYEFDLRGFVIYPSMLPKSMVDRMVRLLQDVKGAKESGKFSFLKLDPIFMEVLAYPPTIEILKALLGEWLRFDHTFGMHMTSATPVQEGLHGGSLENQRSFWYQWAPGGVMHNGLIKVLYPLNDVNPGDGGFICVPGSHKSNIRYRPPEESHLVVNPSLRAGDMLIFTEALVHGSRQWVSDVTRLSLIYSYGPGCLAWKRYETVEPYLQLATNDLQRDLLRPPFVGDYDEHSAATTGEWPMGRRTPVVVPPK